MAITRDITQTLRFISQCIDINRSICPNMSIRFEKIIRTCRRLSTDFIIIHR